jgi:peroxiredoxin
MTVIRRAVLPLALAAACALLVALALDNRRLRSQHVELFRRSVEAHPGMVVPEMTMPTLSGGGATIGAPGQEEHQVLFFFTTTCPYCEASLPAIERITETAREAAVAFLAVALDTLPAVLDYAEEHDLGYPIAVAPDRRVSELYRVRVVPQVTIVGSDNRITYTRSGVLTDLQALDSVMAAIADPAALRPPAEGVVEEETASGGP